MGEVRRERRFRQLARSSEQSWVESLGQAVRSSDRGAIERFLSGVDWGLLTGSASEPTLENVYGDLVAPEAKSAAGTLAVARGLVDPNARDELLARAVTAFSENGICSIQTRANREADTEAGFAVLLSRVLTDTFPGEVGKPVSLPVLLDPGIGHDGVPGRLRLVKLRGGPPGLHPDPRLMTFTRCSSAFVNSLRQAWDSATLSKTEACVLWSLVEGDDAVASVRGGSLGAAMALGLDELAPRSILGRLARRSLLDPKCAVTAEVADGQVLEVSGLAAKLQAAASSGWRVVVSKDSDREVSSLLAGMADAPEVRFASTIEDVVRLARSRPNRRLLVTASVLLALAGLLGGIVFATIGLRNEEIQRAGLEASAAAEGAQATSPRLAALLALAGYELAPGPGTAAKLLNVIDSNSTVKDAVVAHGGEVSLVGGVGDFIVTGSTDRTIATWSTSLTELDRMELDVAPELITTSPTGDQLAVLSGEQVIVVDVDANGEMTVLDKYQDIVGNISSPVALVYTPDGAAIDSVFSGGVVKRRIIGAEANSEWSLFDIVEIAAPAGRRAGVVDAARVPGSADLLVVSNAGDVYQFSPTTASAVKVVEATEGGSAATSIAVASENLILVGTDEGLVSARKYDGDGWRESAGMLGVEGEIAGVVVASDGQVVVQYGRDFVHDEVAYGSVWASDPTATVNATSASLASGQVIVGTSDGRVAAIGEPIPAAQLPPLPGSTVAAFTPDGDFIRSVTSGSANNVTSLEALDLGEASASGPSVRGQYESAGSWYVNEVDASERLLVAGGLSSNRNYGQIIGWDRASGERVFALEVGVAPGSDIDPIVSQIRIAPGGQSMFAFNIATGILSSWSLDGDMARLLGERQIGRGMGSLEFSASGDELVALTWPEVETGLADHQLVALDVQSGAEVWAVDIGGAWRMAVNPSDGTIALLAGTKVELRSKDGQKVLATAELAEDADTLAWSPDGNVLAVLAQPGRLYFLDGESLARSLPVLSTEVETAFGMAWSPDGGTLAVVTPRTEGGFILADTTLLFRPDPKWWVERLCSIAGGDASSSEWERMVGVGIPQRSLCAPVGGP